MLTSIVATLGSGMKGYADGKRQYEEDEFKREQQDRQRKAWKEEDDIKSGLADAAKPIEVKSGEVYQPQVDDEGVPMLPNPTAGTYMAGSKRYSSMAEAQAAAEKANTPEAQTSRMADVYAQKGKAKEAIELRNAAQQSKLVGLQLNEAERNDINSRFNQQLEDDIAENGGFFQAVAARKTKSELGSNQGNSYLYRLGDGGKHEIVQVDKDGKESVYQSFQPGEKGELDARAQMTRVDPKTKLMLIHERVKEQQAQLNWDKSFDENKRQFGEAKALQLLQLQETVRAHKASEGNQAAQINLLKQQRDLELAKFDYLKQQDGTFKLSAPDKLRVESLRERMKTNNAALAKAMAEGTFQSVDASGKPNPLLGKQSELGRELDSILGRYDKKMEGQPSASNPAGLNLPSASPVPAQAASMAGTVAAPPAATPAAPAPAPSMGSAMTQAAGQAPQGAAVAQFGPRMSQVMPAPADPLASALPLSGSVRAADAATNAATAPLQDRLATFIAGDNPPDVLKPAYAQKANTLVSLVESLRSVEQQLKTNASIPGLANQKAMEMQGIKDRITAEISQMQPRQQAQILKMLGIEGM